MKRSRRWLLIFTAVVGVMAHAGALRPPSLHFNKAALKTTSTTTESAPASSSSSGKAEATLDEPTEDEATATSQSSNNTATKQTLTGIPQIDYVWDPNLPRELNGFNLSEYPFYSSVPPEKEIGFKCDGLHDGFYASIKHKCQIYHHCIYGIRHDFLCANYTAFDQKTFICHFASEVDCKNSAKYWFRNDALYKATTTTTTTTTTTSTVAPPHGANRPFRRPFRRRRPVDYYYDEEYDDDYYEERVNRRQKQRPRTRRPEYEEDYEEDMYEKPRPKNRERNREPDDYSYERRPADRSGDKPVERPAERPRHRNRPGDKKRYKEEEEEVEEEKRFIVPPSPPPRKSGKRRRPVTDDYADEERDSGRRFSSSDRRPNLPKANEEVPKYGDDDRRPLGSGIGRRRKGGHRRPVYDDDEEEIVERPLRRDPPKEAALNDGKGDVVAPARPSGSGGSLFSRPRVPPRIPPPVPLNEKKKYEPPVSKKTSKVTTTSKYEEEYYDDYEDVPSPKKTHAKHERYPDTDRESEEPLDSPVAVKEDPKTRYETVADEPIIVDDSRTSPHKNSRHRLPERGGFRSSSIRNDEPKNPDVRFSAPAKSNRDPFDSDLSAERDSHDYKQESRFAPPLKSSRDSYAPDLSTERESNDYDTRDTTGGGRDAARPVVRVIKRPFLPSRGGSPYLPRGLQPVGAAQKPLPTESTPIDMGSTVSAARLLEHGPPLLRANNNEGLSTAPNIARPATGPDYYPSQWNGPRTTQKPQIDQERSALEKLYESEFDVTLNDALNPTLKPITRGLPTGFSNAQNFGRFSSLGNDAYNYRDSLYSPTDTRQTAVQSPAAIGGRTTGQARQQHQHTYYDYDY